MHKNCKGWVIGRRVIVRRSAAPSIERDYPGRLANVYRETGSNLALVVIDGLHSDHPYFELESIQGGVFVSPALVDFVPED